MVIGSANVRLQTPTPTLPLRKEEGAKVSPLRRGRFRGGSSEGASHPKTVAVTMIMADKTEESRVWLSPLNKS